MKNRVHWFFSAGLLWLVLLALVGCRSSRPELTRRGHPSVRPNSEPAQAQPRNHQDAAGQSALEAGNPLETELNLKLAIQANPLDAQAHFLLGCVLAWKGELDQAAVGFERALALDPGHAAAHYNLGTLLLRRGETLSACRLLEKAVLLRPQDARSCNNLGKAYFLAGLPELAVAAYDEALRRDPSDAVARRNRQLFAATSGSQSAAASNPPGEEASSEARDSQPALEDEETVKLRQLVRDLPHVRVERRAGRLTLTGWTGGPGERTILDRILNEAADLASGNGAAPNGQAPKILDLTSADVGDPQRMIEIDAVLFIVRRVDHLDLGYNFLNLVDLNFRYFATGHAREGKGFQAPDTIGDVKSPLTQQGWMFSAAADYVVNIANASDERVAVLARPHLTALSGTPANFLSGGEIVFRVSGLNSGDVKPYEFGTTLSITPTLLRSSAEDGTPLVHVSVDAGRTSVLSILGTVDPDKPVAVDKVKVTSEAVLKLGQTLILSGLSQRESRVGRAGVPGLMYVPLLKYFFSTKVALESDSAVVVLLSPREAGFSNERNRKELVAFVEKHRAFLRALRGTPEDMRRFRERYPDWQEIVPNRFASHLFLMQNSELYRATSGQDLTTEDVDLDLLGPIFRAKKGVNPTHRVVNE